MRVSICEDGGHSHWSTSPAWWVRVAPMADAPSIDVMLSRTPTVVALYQDQANRGRKCGMDETRDNVETPVHDDRT